MAGLNNLITGNGVVDTSSQTRLRLIEIGLDIWKKYPIGGTGINTFYVSSSTGNYAHNNFVELLADIGIIGFVIYYFFIVKAIFVKNNFDVEKGWMWKCLLICLLVFDFGAVTYNVFSIQTIYLIAILCLRNQAYHQDKIADG